MDKNHPKFDQFPVSQLPAATHYGFHNDFADIVAPLEASFPTLTPLLQAYRAALQVESRIYVRPRGLDSTRKLLEADLRRDRLLGVILQTVNAHRANPLEPRRRAAQHLIDLLAPYRGTGRRKYGESSSAYSRLTELLQAEPTASEIALLGLAAEVQALDEAQRAFESVYRGEAADDALLRSELHAIDTQQTRRQVDRAYRALTQYIGALAITQPTDEVLTVVAWHNGAAYRLRQELANQGRRRKRGEADNGTPPTQGAED